MTDIESVATTLLAGGVALVPTDTVYGIAVKASYPGARLRLAHLKGRSADIPIAILVADIGQAAELAELSVTEVAVGEKFWPGPLTLVCEATTAAHEQGLVADDGTIGVRVPGADVVRDLARLVGPLAVTSANAHGKSPATTATRGLADLSGTIHSVVDGGECAGSPSTVARLTPELDVFRAGPISEGDLRHAVRDQV